MNAEVIIGLAIKVSIFLTVLGFALKATFYDAFYLFRKPAQLVSSTMSMSVLMPIFVIFLVLFFNLLPVVRVTLLALSISPIPPVFPKKSFKAGGHESFSIGLLVSASLFAIVLIPLFMHLFEWISGKSNQLPMEKIASMLLTGILAPLALGITIHHFAPSFAEKSSKVVSKVGILLLIIAVLPIAYVVFPSFLFLVGNGSFLAFAAFVVVGITFGHLLGGPETENRTVLALSTATRHPGIAITLATANLEDAKLVPACILLYLLISAIVALPYLKFLHKRKAGSSI